MSSDQASCISNTLTIFFISYSSFNILVTIIFFIAFAHRYYKLKSLNRGGKFKNFFPKFRVILSIIYILISLIVLLFNIAMGLFPLKQAYNYILQGGGGACMNSIVLILQLSVLKMQLITENRYTRLHTVFLLVLMIFSILRFILSFQFDCYIQYTNNQIVNICLSGILAGLSAVQFFYWILKKLPEFQAPSSEKVRDLLNDSFFRHTLLNKSNHFIRQLDSNFLYLVPYVSVEKGQIKIILEMVRKDGQQDGQHRKQSQMLSPVLEQSETNSKNESKMLFLEFYSKQEIQKLYVVCEQLPIQRQINIGQIALPVLAKELQELLSYILVNKQWYRPEILKSLKLPKSYLNYYCQLLRQDLERRKQKLADKKSIPKQLADKNAIYISIKIYKSIWISNHCTLYIRITSIFSKQSVFSIKKYAELQAFDKDLRQFIKNGKKQLVLPFLLKEKDLQRGNNESKNLSKIQLYLRQLTNDSILMQDSEISQKILKFLQWQNQLQIEPYFQQSFYQELRVVKKTVAQAYIRNEFIILYEFQLYHQSTFITGISKSYAHFQELQKEVERWMKNVRINYDKLKLPDLRHQRAEFMRHQKLANYLQNLIQVKDIYKVYAVNAFFNIGEKDPKSLSQTSGLQALARCQKISSQIHYHKDKIEDIELQQNVQKSSSKSSPFSSIMNDHGIEKHH